MYKVTMYKIVAISLLMALLGSYALSMAAGLAGPKDFPELINADIPGAPKLGKPILIMGATGPVKSEGAGWAAPAVWDWDGDGKQDLLIGEFASGYEHSKLAGHFIRVYRNVGSNIAPEFTDKFYYARYAHNQSPNGAAMSINTWCCHGFTPRFIDLDNDGRKDMIAGQYDPGEVIWFRNTEAGFQAGTKLKQAGDPGGVKTSGDIPVPGKKNAFVEGPGTDPKTSSYWRYSSASFGDFDSDGDHDLIVGGSRLRISKNIGSKTKPKFGLRKLLLDINGKPLRVYPFTEQELKKESESGVYGKAGDSTVPLVVDWDQDGVLDLLVTGAYLKKGLNAVTFFRGVKTRDGHRFEPGKPLFTKKRGGKAFPGSWLRIYVTDWNSDGVNDLLIGTSVATVNGGEFDHSLSWEWESDTGTAHLNPGLPAEYNTLAQAKFEVRTSSQKFIEQVKERHKYLLNGGDPSLVHQGYVYVMLGERR